MNIPYINNAVCEALDEVDAIRSILKRVSLGERREDVMAQLVAASEMLSGLAKEIQKEAKNELR